MKKLVFKNNTFLKVIIGFVLVGFLGVAYTVYAVDDNKPILNIIAKANKSSIYVNEEFDVTYTITPPELAVGDVNKISQKEIILVVDTSGSMAEALDNTTRIAALKVAANEFISKFADEGNVKIGIVSYDYNAVQKIGLTNTKNVMTNGKVTTDNQKKLKDIINGLQAKGATNIGDGIRIAQNMFSNDTTTKKYLVLMSDGMPTALTYTGTADGRYNGRTYTESPYSVSGLSNVYWWSQYITKGTWNYYNGQSGTIKYGTYGSSDPKGYCLEYSTKMAETLLNPNKKVTNYVIGFSGGSDSSKLTQIANAGGGNYYDARNSSAITNVYKDIADKIKADYSVEEVKLNFTPPTGLEYSMNDFDTLVSGNSYSKFIPNIAYKLDAAKQLYTAEAFNVTLKFKGIAAGTYDLFSSGTLTYKYLSGNVATIQLPKASITVLKYDTQITMSRILKPESNKGQFNINNEFEMEYSIVPSPIVLPNTEKPKEIMLVVDTSGSMSDDINGIPINRWNDWFYGKRKSKLELAKDALNNFINKFNGVSNVKIGLVTYASTGNVFMNNGNYLFDSATTGIIKDKVKGLGANGGTNLGDGIRRALWALSSNKDSKKYIILMTDGEPTFYSYYNSNYYTEIDNSNPSYNDGNNFDKGLEYSNIMAGILKENKDLGLKTYAIGFSKDANADKLKEIAANAGGDYFDATGSNESAINEVYSNIAEEIKTDLALQNVKFTQQLPDGLVLSETGGTSIVKDLKVNYTYNSTTKQYEAEPISFTIKVKGAKVGNYELKNDAKLSFKDFDGTSSEKFFDPLNISILDTFIIKQGLFQPNGNNPNIIHVGEKNIKYIREPELGIAPNMEYQIGTFIRTSGQETPISIQLNSNNNSDVTKMSVASVNVYSVKEDGSLEKISSLSPTIENNNSTNPRINVTLNGETNPGYKYYIINYNYRVDEVTENSNSTIINKAGITGTDKFNEFKTKIGDMPDVF